LTPILATDLTRDRVIVAGDMNDIPTAAPMAPLLTVPHLHDALAIGLPADADR
jgi:hypothetical protein